MRRWLWLAILVVVSCVAHAQSPPLPPYVAYINPGSGWVPWSASLGSGFITPQPPGIALYCSSNGTTWSPCNPSGGGGGTTTNALTMNNGGSGAASGTTFNGSAAATISYNTIGAASSGANSNITSLTGLTTPLSAAQGGTGAEVTGLRYGNTASADSAATSTQVQTAIGSNIYVPAAVVNSASVGMMFSSGYPAMRGVSLTTQTYTAHDVYACRFVMPYTMTIGHAAIAVTTLLSGGTVDVGFYNSAGTSLLLDSGSLSTTTAVGVAASFSQVTLYQNTTYLFAWSVSSSTPALEALTGAAGALQNALNAVSGTVDCGTAANTATGSALPTSTGALTLLAASQPVVVWQY
jgi:hypothetical protein